MWADIKFYFVWGVIWVFEKLRIITKEDAERHRNILWMLAFGEAILKREKEERSWGLR